MNQEIILRYGINPHQQPARITVKKGKLPLKVLNGNPSYINLLDALCSWQLVKELKQALHLPAAASFKHVSPAGAAVAIPLREEEKRAYFVQGMDLSPLAIAYARARGADRLSSFGDWVALSEACDVPTARLLEGEVSDGIIAPGYEEEALKKLKKKKKGTYVVLEIDPFFEPPETESREVFGILFEQKRNDVVFKESYLQNIVTKSKALPAQAKRDLIVASIAVKYTPSNAVVIARDGQVTGVGAGQPSRIQSTRIACEKAELWWLRQHPGVLQLEFKAEFSKPERDSAIDLYLRDQLSPAEKHFLEEALRTPFRQLNPQEKLDWKAKMENFALSSDAFFPFRDSIDRCVQSGVKFIAQPGGSIRDKEVIEACDEYEVVMAMTNLRLFHH